MASAVPGIKQSELIDRDTSVEGPEARPAGVSMRLDANCAAGYGPAAARVQRELSELIAEPGAVTVRVLGLACTDPVRAFTEVCNCAARAKSDALGQSAGISLAVDAHDIEPGDAWSIRLATLGRGPLYFVGTDARLESDRVLRQLWPLRSERMVSTAFWPLVSSPTPLLVNEVGDDLMPGPGLQSPSGSAWVWVNVRLSDCVHGGRSCMSRLDDLLKRALMAADIEHGRCRWPSAAARHDAWLNRRVAVELSHLGEWVRGSGLSPGKLSTLAAVDDLLAHASRRLMTLSRGMARGSTLPAIEASDPCRQLGDDRLGDAWRERWRFAIEQAGIAHRNLMVMSPWSLFEVSADVRAFNLIPALRHVDACTFRRRVGIEHWTVDEYREFHRRVWAVMRQKARPSLVAEEL